MDIRALDFCGGGGGSVDIIIYLEIQVNKIKSAYST